ncbi:hypothetical protein LBW89_21085 [Paenibacillus sp. alder61]|uniref:hypothetical protein n=1 Tax=Paenibacillus TaxID=44249 RepID=UPI001CD34784|nr:MULTISPECIES: hypothetical protein [Paenibacillus]MCA1295506.1 hypothetical protein [Paenibacillus sp. alder61]
MMKYIAPQKFVEDHKEEFGQVHRIEWSKRSRGRCMDLYQRKRWNENHKQLTGILTKAAEHEKAVELF